MLPRVYVACYLMNLLSTVTIPKDFTGLILASASTILAVAIFLVRSCQVAKHIRIQMYRR
jgi:hypothetical protein